MTRGLLLLAAALGAAGASGCATLGRAGTAPATAAPDVSDQLFKIQKDTATLLDQIGRAHV